LRLVHFRFSEFLLFAETSCTKSLECSRVFWKVQGIIFISIDVENRKCGKLRITDPRETEGSLKALYFSEILVAFIRLIKETLRALLDTCAVTLAHINHYNLFFTLIRNSVVTVVLVTVLVFLFVTHLRKVFPKCCS
jgi:hypothetical protein